MKFKRCVIRIKICAGIGYLLLCSNQQVNSSIIMNPETRLMILRHINVSKFMYLKLQILINFSEMIYVFLFLHGKVYNIKIIFIFQFKIFSYLPLYYI